MLKQAVVCFGFATMILSNQSRAASERIVYAFSASGLTDGQSPETTLLSLNGFLFGVATGGGNHGCSYGDGCGAIFKTTTDGREAIVQRFRGDQQKAGAFANQLSYVDGSFYTTGCCDGKVGKNADVGNGIAFKIGQFGGLAQLHRFGQEADGAIPRGRLTYLDGVFYGVTQNGGAHGNGTVFSLMPDGIEKVIYSFRGGDDGAGPEAGLISVHKVLYGTTAGGGATHNGTVFAITPAGDEHVVHSFSGGEDGSLPESSLIEVGDSLYGTTYYGGGKRCGGTGCGTVFKVQPDGQETVLHAFQSGMDDGALPQAELTYMSGMFYGTTTLGGNNRGCPGGGLGCGTVFELSTTGSFSLLHRFQDGADDGTYPSSGLVSIAGTLYGVTLGGGGNGGGGTVYGVTP